MDVMNDDDTIAALKLKVELLEAELRTCRFLSGSTHEMIDRMDRALRRYAAGETGTTIARECLGIFEYWDADYGGWLLPLRRMWRRFKEQFWKGGE